MIAGLRFLLLSCLFGSVAAFGQQSKTYKETFKVDPEVSVALNTSHADIEFETWNRNEVVVEAVITLEGASEEEAAAYFESGGLKIMGSSSLVEIKTGAEPAWGLRFNAQDMEGFEFAIPEIHIPEFDFTMENIVIPEVVIPEMPPVPPVPDFDHEAYEKEGEAYMKRWQEAFKEKFTPEFQQRMEEWSERIEVRTEELQKRMEERQAELEERAAAREEERAARMEERERVREQAMKAREDAAKVRQMAREVERKARADADRSRVFFMRGAEGDRNFSIKKTIRIKMPKNAKLKLNVRHGEVKLAENAHNMQATLSYARLLASTIDGDQTNVSVRYSPVAVKAWNGGRLSADFSTDVRLEVVGKLDLAATSSDVTIAKLLRQAHIRNNLGGLQIQNVAQDFSTMEISVQNGKVECQLPETPYVIRVANHASNVAYPKGVVWEGGRAAVTGNRQGYCQQADAGRSVVINASYSDVKLQ